MTEKCLSFKRFNFFIFTKKKFFSMSRRTRSISSAICCKRRFRSSTPTLGSMASKRSEASLVHALFIIFLEYFSWGLLTVPVINVRLR